MCQEGALYYGVRHLRYLALSCATVVYLLYSCTDNKRPGVGLECCYTSSCDKRCISQSSYRLSRMNEANERAVSKAGRAKENAQVNGRQKH